MADTIEVDSPGCQLLILTYTCLKQNISLPSQNVRIVGSNYSRDINLADFHEPFQVKVSSLGRRLRVLDQSGKQVYSCDFLQPHPVQPQPDDTSNSLTSPRPTQAPGNHDFPLTPISRTTPGTPGVLWSADRKQSSDSFRDLSFPPSSVNRGSKAETPTPVIKHEEHEAISIDGDEKVPKTAMSAQSQAFLESLFGAMLQEQEWTDYAKPVDSKALSQLAGNIFLKYPQIITRPVDLGTIAKDIRAKQYQTLQAVTADVHQMVRNARTWFEYYYSKTKSDADLEVVHVGERLKARYDAAISAFQSGTIGVAQLRGLERIGKRQTAAKLAKRRNISPGSEEDLASFKPQKKIKRAVTVASSVTNMPRSKNVKPTVKRRKARKKVTCPHTKRPLTSKKNIDNMDDECCNVAFESENTSNTSEAYDSYDDGEGFVASDISGTDEVPAGRC